MGKDKVKKPFYKKVWFWALVVIVIAIGGIGGSGIGGSGSDDSSKDSKSSSSSSEVSKVESAKSSEVISGQTSASSTTTDQAAADKAAASNSNAGSSSQAPTTSQQTDVDTISLGEGIALIDKAGAEAARNGVEIISSNDHSITIGSEVGAKGYDKTTLTPNNDGTVHIYQEYGTLDGGTYSILDYRPAKEFNVPIASIRNMGY